MNTSARKECTREGRASKTVILRKSRLDRLHAGKTVGIRLVRQILKAACSNKSGQNRGIEDELSILCTGVLRQIPQESHSGFDSWQELLLKKQLAGTGKC